MTVPISAPWTNANGVVSAPAHPSVVLPVAPSGTVGPTANSAVIRDSGGRSQFNTPVSNLDAANKAYVDSELASDLSLLPIGWKAFSEVQTNPTLPSATDPVLYLLNPISVSITAGRRYRFDWKTGFYTNGSRALGEFNLHMTTNGSLPTVASTMIDQIAMYVYVAGRAVTNSGYCFYNPTSSATLRLRVRAAVYDFTDVCYAWGFQSVVVTDVGRQ